MRLKDKVALITGSTRGIGKEYALGFAREGAHVLVNGRNVEKARAVAKEVEGFGVQAVAIGADVSKSQEVTRMVEEAIQQFGRIDILVNNAGVAADGLFMIMPEDDWDRVIQTTLKGFYNVTKPVIKRMLVNHRGSVVSISSVSALIGNRGQANYAAAKAGLIGASRSLAAEVARIGIRVNVVAPGLIDTEMIKGAPVGKIKEIIPMARIGRPEEVAKVVRFLCSDDASYITGQVLSVNGGMF